MTLEKLLRGNYPGDPEPANSDDAYTGAGKINLCFDAVDTITSGGNYLLADGTVPLTANWDVGGFSATNLSQIQVEDATSILTILPDGMLMSADDESFSIIAGPTPASATLSLFGANNLGSFDVILNAKNSVSTFGYFNLTGEWAFSSAINVTGNATVTSNILVGGTVDGRDVATDGGVLDALAAQTTMAGYNISDTKANFNTALSDGSFMFSGDVPTAHTIASHSDTTATGAELETLTDNSIADTLHRHSELVASDGSPDPALSIDTIGNATVNAGDLIVGTSGKGIDYSAAGGSVLDQYKEGTFTASLNGSTGGTPVTTTGYYTKIGNAIFATFDFSNVDTTGMTGNVEIKGWPESASRLSNGNGWVWNLVANNDAAFGLTGTTMFIRANGSGSLQTVSAGTGRYLRVSVVYHV